MLIKHFYSVITDRQTETGRYLLSLTYYSDYKELFLRALAILKLQVLLGKLINFVCIWSGLQFYMFFRVNMSLLYGV